MARNCAVIVAEPALEDEAPAHEGGQRADLLGDQHRIPERQQEEAARRLVAPLREQAAQHRHVLVVLARRGVVIADEERVEVGPAGRRRALDHEARARARVLHHVATRQRNPQTHANPPRACDRRPDSFSSVCRDLTR